MVGGIMPGSDNWRAMVTGGEEVPHKCVEIESIKISNNGFYYNKEAGDSHSCLNGQYGNLVLFKENWEE